MVGGEELYPFHGGTHLGSGCAQSLGNMSLMDPHHAAEVALNNLGRYFVAGM